jgi:hypothetical protein
MDKAKIKIVVQKWFVLSNLTQRYTSSPETQMDRDLRAIKEKGFEFFSSEIEAAELSDVFWEVGLTQMLETTSVNNPAYNTYLAAQVFFNDVSFLSNSSKVADLISSGGDMHHIFPKSYLKKNGLSNRVQYNQISNFTFLDTPVNISIGEKAPNEYIHEAYEQCENGQMTAGSIMDREQLEKNLLDNCIPLETRLQTYKDFQAFLIERRKLMANKIKEFYKKIGSFQDKC